MVTYQRYSPRCSTFLLASLIFRIRSFSFCLLNPVLLPPVQTLLLSENLLISPLKKKVLISVSFHDNHSFVNRMQSVRTPVFSGLVTSHPAGLASNVYLHFTFSCSSENFTSVCRYELLYSLLGIRAGICSVEMYQWSLLGCRRSPPGLQIPLDLILVCFSVSLSPFSVLPFRLFDSILYSFLRFSNSVELLNCSNQSNLHFISNLSLLMQKSFPPHTHTQKKICWVVSSFLGLWPDFSPLIKKFSLASCPLMVSYFLCI